MTYKLSWSPNLKALNPLIPNPFTHTNPKIQNQIMSIIIRRYTVVHIHHISVVADFTSLYFVYIIIALGCPYEAAG